MAELGKKVDAVLVGRADDGLKVYAARQAPRILAKVTGSPTGSNYPWNEAGHVSGAYALLPRGRSGTAGSVPLREVNGNTGVPSGYYAQAWLSSDGTGYDFSYANNLLPTVVLKTSSFTASSSDNLTTFLIDSSGGSVVATLPAASTLTPGFEVSLVYKQGTGAVSIKVNPSDVSGLFIADWLESSSPYMMDHLFAPCLTARLMDSTGRWALFVQGKPVVCNASDTQPQYLADKLAATTPLFVTPTDVGSGVIHLVFSVIDCTQGLRGTVGLSAQWMGAGLKRFLNGVACAATATTDALAFFGQASGMASMWLGDGVTPGSVGSGLAQWNLQYTFGVSALGILSSSDSSLPVAYAVSTKDAAGTYGEYVGGTAGPGSNPSALKHVGGLYVSGTAVSTGDSAGGGDLSGTYPGPTISATYTYNALMRGLFL